MTLRPVSASWFELLTSREELGATLDCLAVTGSVQLEAYSRSEQRLALPDLRTTLAEYETLARRYGHYWPCASDVRHGQQKDLLEAPRESLERVRAWTKAADPLIAELEELAQAAEDTALLAQLQVLSGDGLARLDQVARAGPVLAGRAYLLPEGGPPHALPPNVLLQRVPLDQRWFLLAVGPADEIAALDQALAARKARVIPLPGDLPADPAGVSRHLESRKAALEERERAARAELDALSEQQGIATALGELTLAAWLVTHVPELPVTEHFAWVTGWCAHADDSQLRAALDSRDLHYLLRFTPAPENSVAPSVLRNPAWARPFEVFGRLMGVPGTREADPSMLLALVAPLMFGFMFGDVVQGLIVAILGFTLRNRLPALRLLVPGGLFAVAFGFAFGSVFAREDIIPALWLHPLGQPLTVLGTALAFGVIVILLGLLLNALQYHWRGELTRWFATEAGILVAYLGIVGTVFDARLLWLLPLGIVWMLAGSALMAQGDRLGSLGHAAGESIERLLQLGVNTVSFVRVGAFALAHAGLCTAVVGIAEAAGPAYWPVLVLGNAAIIALEGLVVGIQTTRLILFEFFLRFLTAHGRPFEPLTPPSPPPPSLPRSKS
jgi:V/A-type H+/Na+-transporting ATPase subunit I